MTVCIYCDKRTRADRVSLISGLNSEAMCASCAKRRGTMPHDLYLKVALHAAEVALAEQKRHIDRLSYAAGITGAAAPKPTPAQKEDLMAAMRAWDEDD